MPTGNGDPPKSPLVHLFHSVHLCFPTCINPGASYPEPPSTLSILLLLIWLTLHSWLCCCSYITLVGPFKPGRPLAFKSKPKHLFLLLKLSSKSQKSALCWHRDPASFPSHSEAMLESLSRRSRSLLSLTLTSLALALSILALCTSYWCEGTHKVVKPLCLSPVKMKNCGQNNSEPYTTESPTPNPFNRTLSPARREELAKIRQRQLANAVHYIWETGEDKFAFRYFHTGFWESCEKHNDDDRHSGTEGLEASDVGLWLVVCPCLGVLQLLYGGRRGDAQLLHQDHYRETSQAEVAPGRSSSYHSCPVL
ncbi:uncharacterized protein ACB058_012544 isoform 5-T7 [Synchiropus picturatus]